MEKFKDDWVPIIQKYVRRLKLGTKIKIVDADWREISNDIITHIWQKSKFYNEDKPLNCWIKTIVSNKFKNYVRDRFFLGKETSCFLKRAKLNLVFAKSLSKIELYEPEENTYPYESNDMLDAKTLNYYYNRITVDEYKEYLTDKEINILNLKLQDYSEREISEKLKIKIGTVYRANLTFRAKYKELLNK